MKQINDTKYFMLPDGSVVRPLKAQIKSKGKVKYYNLRLEGRLRAYSEKKIKAMYDEIRS